MVILFDQFHLPEDIFQIIFATEQQVIVAKLLVNEIKNHAGSIGKTEMSMFATKLHDGITTETEEELGPITKKKTTKLSYNKRQFYDRIVTPMKSMGILDYDMYKKQYIISDRFQKSLLKIGNIWLQELKKPIKPQ